MIHLEPIEDGGCGCCRNCGRRCEPDCVSDAGAHCLDCDPAATVMLYPEMGGGDACLAAS